MASNFTQFKYRAPEAVDVGDAISITRLGDMRISAHFADLHGIALAYVRIGLYWDAGRQAMALVFTSEEDQSAFRPFRLSGGGCMISALRFFLESGIDRTATAGVYPVKTRTAREVGIAGVPGEHEVYVLDLSKPPAHTDDT